MKTITLDNLRGMAMRGNSTLDLFVVRHLNHWSLQIDHALLLDARDDVRSFRTLDAIHNFVVRHVSGYGCTCRVIVLAHAGLAL